MRRSLKVVLFLIRLQCEGSWVNFRTHTRVISRKRPRGAVIRMIETHIAYQEALRNNVSATLQRHADKEADRRALTDLGSPLTEMIRFSYWPAKRVEDSDGRAFLVAEEDHYTRVIPFKADGKDFGANIELREGPRKRISGVGGLCLYLRPGRFGPVGIQISNDDREHMRKANSEKLEANRIYERARDRTEAERQSRGSVLRMAASPTAEDYGSARVGNRTKSYRKPKPGTLGHLKA